LITNLTPEEYPLFEDFLKYIRNELYEEGYENGTKIAKGHLTDSRIRRLEDIELVIEDAVNVYGDLFNKPTSIPDFENEQVVMFSIRALTSYEKGVFNAQMHNALSLIWDNLITIGSPQ